jgi:hypothetical protein
LPCSSLNAEESCDEKSNERDACSCWYGTGGAAVGIWVVLLASTVSIINNTFRL